jgi:hypothetical protein
MSRGLAAALALVLVASGLTSAFAREPARGAPEPAAVPVPAACADGGPKQRAHVTGRRQGASMVQSAWAAVHRACAELAHVEQVVHDAIAHNQPPAGASEVVKCRSTGFEIGAEDELSRLGATCSGN